ncbi:MAG: hypothetical protein JRJ68_11940 [Deltaproteobacteria bacterium]|nr:hypothetical protein [Deltaproteobacteria bacterium]
MRRVCAWCKKNMGKLPLDTQARKTVSHGMCEECANRIFAELGMESRSFLDDLAAPVLVVDQSGKVLFANRLARILLKKDLEDIKDYQMGDVGQCMHANLPSGCGKTVHCGQCTIRATVMDTFQSGISKLEERAYINCGIPENYKKIDLLISTEKTNGIVLLRIDEVGRGAGW